MKEDGDIVSYTAAELRAMIERGEDHSDWARVDAMTEEELEAAIASDPDWADIPHDWHEHTTPQYPESMRRQISLRIDPDLLAWFKRQGRAIASGSTARCEPSSKRRSVARRSDTRRTRCTRGRAHSAAADRPRLAPPRSPILG